MRMPLVNATAARAFVAESAWVRGVFEREMPYRKVLKTLFACDVFSSFTTREQHQGSLT
jgi:hypothetical protein